MSLIDFTNVLKFVRGDQPSEEEKDELFKEMALMTLARATSADTNIENIELSKVQEVLERATGELFSLPDIKTAAQSQIFEQKPLAKYLSSVGRKLDAERRVEILRLLEEVVHADGRVSHFETDYFDMVAEALKATPSELVGMVPARLQRSDG